MSKCKISSWILGLIPLALIALLFIVGEGARIERDLVKRSTEALHDQGFYWAEVKFKGRDGILTGNASSPEERSKAIRTVTTVSGVGTVRDRAKLLDVVKPYVWSTNHKEGSIRVKGHVPGEAERQTILGIVKANLPGMEVEDRMKLAAGAPERQRWIGAISFALKQLSQLKRGNARLIDMELVLLGEAVDAQSYAAVISALNSPLPAGLTLKHHEIQPARAKPYAWGVQKRGGTVTLQGHVPSEKARKLVLDKVKENFIGSTVEDRMALGSGAPKNWFQAVELAIKQVAQLEEGEAVVQDSDFTITGNAADDSTAETVKKALDDGLPKNFKATNTIGVIKRSVPETEEKPKAEPGGKPEKTTAQTLNDTSRVYLWLANPSRSTFSAGRVYGRHRHSPAHEAQSGAIWPTSGRPAETQADTRTKH